MTREEITVAVRQISDIAAALQNLRYREAVDPLISLDDLQNAVLSQLPGGYAGECRHCELSVGKDDCQADESGITCFACLDAGEDLPTIAETYPLNFQQSNWARCLASAAGPYATSCEAHRGAGWTDIPINWRKKMGKPLSNSYEDEDFKRVVDEHEADDERVEEIMASARGQASKIREGQKRRKKMAKQELGIPKQLLEAVLKSRKLDRQQKRVAESIPDDMTELYVDALGQFSFIQPEGKESAAQAAAREAAKAAQEREDAEQAEGEKILDELTGA